MKIENPKHRPGTYQPGFSLLELLVVMAIAVVVMTIAVPSFTSTIRNNQMVSVFNNMLGDFAFARSEAVKQNAAVSLCPTTTPNAAAPTCNGSDWETGWLIFVDDDSNRVLNGTDTLLRVHQAVDSSITITSQNFVAGSGIRYEGSGKMESGDPTDIGQIVLCNADGDTGAKGVTFSAFGQFNIMRDTDSNNIVDYDVANTATDISC